MSEDTLWMIVGFLMVAFGVLVGVLFYLAERRSRARANQYASLFGLTRMDGETTPELMRRVRNKISITGGRRW